MNASAVLSLDFGTTFCKCAAHDGTRFVAEAKRPIVVDHSAPGVAEISPDAWKSAAIAVLRDVADALSEKRLHADAVCVSTCGPGIILSDGEGNALLPSPNWQDTRCATEGEWLIEHIGAEWVGQGMPKTSLAARVLWYDRHHPALLQKAVRVQDNKGFVLSFLTGNRVSDVSCSGRAAYDWTAALCEISALRGDQLDMVLPVEGIAGGLLARIAEVTGLPVELPVIAGLNDGAAAMLGAGVLASGNGLVSLSTNGVARILTAKRPSGETLVEHGLFCTRYVADQWVLGGFTKSAGDTLQWLGELLYASLSEARRLDALTAGAAACPPGAEGLRFVPGLYGAGAPKPGDVPCAAFRAMARSHTRAHLSRAVMEGICCGIRAIGDMLSEIASPWGTLCCAGGGMQNPLWRQMLADILGRALYPVRSDSLLGGAIVAAVATGRYADYADAVAAMAACDGTPVIPNAGVRPLYDELYREYRSYAGLAIAPAFPREKEDSPQ